MLITWIDWYNTQSPSHACIIALANAYNTWRNTTLFPPMSRIQSQLMQEQKTVDEVRSMIAVK